ncbi:MAG: hypothetical protein U9P72_12510 [Campylobacterota bacterium]|nr:hypothetical protein [Campylobacterota bacterium]
MNNNKEEKTNKYVYNHIMKLEDLKNKKIVMFGKSRAFRSDEFQSQMKYHNIEILKEYSDEVIVVVEGKMMTPYEQIASENLYEDEKPNYITIDLLEDELAKHIDSDTLLMSLKLSHDKERLKDFITNSTISDELFFRLIKLYNWGGEDFFENDDNRDVSASFILRFYENIERNHNIQFATTGFIHLVAQTKDLNVLKVISDLKPLKFHPKIKLAITMSIYCDENMQRRFFNSGDEKVIEALSFNKNLDINLVKEFLKENKFCENIAHSIELNDELFMLLDNYKLFLASNESLNLEMQEKLLAKRDEKIDLALSTNDNLDEKIIKTLLSYENGDIEVLIYENSATPVSILEEAYKNQKYHLSLAKNENTPIDILYQLELDAKYSRFVKTNAGYGKHIKKENIGWL